MAFTMSVCRDEGQCGGARASAPGGTPARFQQCAGLLHPPQASCAARLHGHSPREALPPGLSHLPVSRVTGIRTQELAGVSEEPRPGY